MKYKEFGVLKEYYEAEDDIVTPAKSTDTRRVKLTLTHLRKLRKKREMRKLEQAQRLERLNQIYGSAGDEGGDAPEF